MGLSRRIACLAFVANLILPGVAAPAGTWDSAASELTRKIFMHTPPRSVMSLSVKNQSTLTESDVAEIGRLMRAQLRAQGARVLKTARPQVLVSVTLSENLQGFLWVAEIRRGAAHEVVIVQLTRPPTEKTSAPAETVELRKTPLYEQAEPILDLVELAAPAAAERRILVLDPGKVAVYTLQAGHWVPENSLPLVRSHPWPRDPRGRVVPREGSLFSVFTPGTLCKGAYQPALTLDCSDSDEPWPLVAGGAEELSAHFDSHRNFFDGAITLAGKEAQVPPFFSLASFPEALGALRIYAGLDGRARLIEKGSEPVRTFQTWGSDLAALQSGCGSGWQILATRAGDSTQPDSVQAYALRGPEAVLVGTPVDFPGPVTSLWPSPSGQQVLAVTRNLKTGMYEASTLTISCNP